MKYVHYHPPLEMIKAYSEVYNVPYMAAKEYLTKVYNTDSDIKTGKLIDSKKQQKGILNSWNEKHITSRVKR